MRPRVGSSSRSARSHVFLIEFASRTVNVLRWSYLPAANENEKARSNPAKAATAPFTAESAAPDSGSPCRAAFLPSRKPTNIPPSKMTNRVIASCQLGVEYNRSIRERSQQGQPLSERLLNLLGPITMASIIAAILRLTVANPGSSGRWAAAEEAQYGRLPAGNACGKERPT